MNKLKFNILFILVIVLFAYPSLAISISPAGKEMVYDPAVGIDEEFELRLGASSSNTGFIDVKVTGYSTPFGLPEGTVLFNESEMKEYVSVSSESIDPAKENTVLVKVKIPPNTPLYGPHVFGISATERPRDSSGFLTVTTAVLFKVGIDAPYPNQYVDIVKFKIDSVNEGESSKLYWQVKGRSSQETYFDAALEIKSKEGVVVFKRDLGSSSVERHEVYPADNYYEPLPTNTFTPGTYDATLTVKFLNNIKKSEIKFDIGTESVALEDYNPKTLVYAEINEVTLNVRNLWNGQFNNVYGTIEISGENISTVKTTTPSGVLGPFGKLELKQFFDVRSLPEGNYTGKITINFDTYSTSFPAEFTVAKKVIPVVEEEKGLSAKQYVLIGIVAGAILIIVLVLLLFFRKKKEGDKSQSQAPQIKQTPQVKTQSITGKAKK